MYVLDTNVILNLHKNYYVSASSRCRNVRPTRCRRQGQLNA